jgi:hypothetical protein
MKQLATLVNELETKIQYCETFNAAISKEPVGWHIQHSLLVALQIITAVEKSNPTEYKPAFNMRKFIIYTLNKIPRGKAKAPESVIPSTSISANDLNNNIEKLKSRLTVLDTLQPGSFFKHPYFGNLNLKETKKMLRLHTKHHLNIINDIIKG